MKYFRWLMIICVIVLLIYMSIFFGSYYSLMSAFVCGGVIFVDILLFAIPFGSINVDFTSLNNNCYKGDKNEIYIIFHSRRLQPVRSLNFDVVIKHRFYGEKRIPMSLALPMFFLQKVKVPVVLDKSGVVKITVENMRYSDTFGILSKKTRCDNFYSVVVMPVAVESNESGFGTTDSEEIPAVNVYLSNNGDIKGYRDYMPGDKTNHINWKMYSSKGNMLVREFERSSADDAVVLLDMNKVTLDKGLDILAGINNKGHYTLMWLPAGNEEFELASVTDEESFKDAIYRIFDSQPQQSADTAIVAYKRVFKGNSVLYITDRAELV